jgi:hypothetical protein
MASFGSGLAHTARTINLRRHIRERRFVDCATQITNRESKSSIEHLAENRRSALNSRLVTINYLLTPHISEAVWLSTLNYLSVLVTRLLSCSGGLATGRVRPAGGRVACEH